MKKNRITMIRYAALWLALALTVGAVRLTGGGQAAPEPAAPESTPVPKAGPAPSPTPEPAPEPKELAGVWVPYLSLNAPEHTREAFEENFRAIADLAAQKGLNALFVHVRPFCDALYPSTFYPWSHLLTGEQGKDPGWDPLAFLVDYTHSLGMEFHAWINPLRIATAETPSQLSADNPYLQLREDCPYYFMEYEGGVYWDPAWPYVRQVIAEGAAEIVEKYDVDGIHFDDYFYPTREEGPDSVSYELYAGSVETPVPLEEWRRANISTLVQEVYRRVKAADETVRFGISPQGNIENDEAMGADVRAWCAVPGYVDYLCPQLYYSFDHPVLGYGEALEEWLALPRRQGLDLYAGLALYKAGTDADGGTWQPSGDQIRRQITAAREARCAGVVLYSADYLDGEQTAGEMANAVEVLAPRG